MSRLAEAIRDHARDQGQRARNVVLGEVTDTKPLKVDLMGSALTLDDDDFDLTAWMESYDDEFGIAVGDTVFLMRESGEWFVFDIRPEDPPEWGKAKSVDARIKALEARVEALES